MLSSLYGLSVGFHFLSSSQQIATLRKSGADNLKVYSLGFVSGTGAGPSVISPPPDRTPVTVLLFSTLPPFPVVPPPPTT